MTYTQAVQLTKGLPEMEVAYEESVFHVTENTGIKTYDKYKISILLSDGICAVMNDTVIHSRVGDVLFFRPDEIHFGRVLTAGVHRYLDLYIPLDYFSHFGVLCDKVAAFLEHREGQKGNCLRPQATDRATLVKLAQDMAHTLKNGEKQATLTTALRCFEVLSLCADRYDKGLSAVTDEAVPPCVRTAVAAISAGYAEKMSLEQMAVDAGCSVTYLSRKFKEYVGCSVYAYLMQYRLAMAERLLKGGKSITEACYECGFYDCSHFIKCFKKQYGVTPRVYKKQPN